MKEARGPRRHELHARAPEDDEGGRHGKDRGGRRTLEARLEAEAAPGTADDATDRLEICHRGSAS